MYLTFFYSCAASVTCFTPHHDGAQGTSHVRGARTTSLSNSALNVVAMLAGGYYRNSAATEQDMPIGAILDRTVELQLETVSGKNLFSMVKLEKPAFDAAAFLMSARLGRKIVHLAPEQHFFSQGDPANSIFYLQEAAPKVTVVSQAGKEATITLLAAGDFVGEGALVAVPGLRLSTATAITACTVLKRSGPEEMARVIRWGRLTSPTCF